MSKRPENKQYLPKKQKLSAAELLIGIPFLCDVDLVGTFLLTTLKETYHNLITTSNERDEVLNDLNEIPNGLERDVAKFMNDAHDVMTRGNKRRCLDKKISSKPHLHMVTAIRSARNIYTRR